MLGLPNYLYSTPLTGSSSLSLYSASQTTPRNLVARFDVRVGRTILPPKDVDSASGFSVDPTSSGFAIAPPSTFGGSVAPLTVSDAGELASLVVAVGCGGGVWGAVVGRGGSVVVWWSLGCGGSVVGRGEGSL